MKLSPAQKDALVALVRVNAVFGRPGLLPPWAVERVTEKTLTALVRAGAVAEYAGDYWITEAGWRRGVGLYRAWLAQTPLAA